MSFLLFISLVCYSIIPSHPPPRVGGLSHCSGNMSGLVEVGENLFLSFSHVLGEIGGGGGRWTWINLGGWSEKFLIGPP